jgi:hypothetical protein
MKVFRTFDPLPKTPRKFCKKTFTMAVQMDKDFTIITLEGVVKGKAGDYMAKGIKGELYPIAKEIFEATYEEVKE